MDAQKSLKHLLEEIEPFRKLRPRSSIQSTEGLWGEGSAMALKEDKTLKWIKVWDSGYHYEQAFDSTGKLLAEIHEQWSDQHLFDACLCVERPYQDLGEFKTLKQAKQAIKAALATVLTA